MAKNYLHIPAVGQLDAMACWAACLKWWFKINCQIAEKID